MVGAWVEVAWERRNPPKALKSFCLFVRPGRGTREKPVFPVACRQDRQKPLTFSAKPCRIAATLRSAPLLLGGPLLLVAAFPYGCFAVIEVAPPALPQPPATRPVSAFMQLTPHTAPPGTICGTRFAGPPNPGAWYGLPSSHAPGGHQSSFLVTPFGPSSWPRHHPVGLTTRTPLPCSVPVALPLGMGASTPT